MKQDTKELVNVSYKLLSLLYKNQITIRGETYCPLSQDDMAEMMNITRATGKDVPTRNDHLLKLLSSISRMDFGDYTDNAVNLLGDAYEFLMGIQQMMVRQEENTIYNKY